MPRVIKIGGAIVITIILVLFCFIFLYQKIKINNIVEDCKAKHGYQAASCIWNFALQRNDDDYCQLIDKLEINSNKIDYKSECVKILAIYNQDLSKCKKIINKNTADICIFEIAKGTKDHKICASMTNPDNCIKEIANYNKTPEICKLIKDTEIKNECQRNANPECTLPKYSNDQNDGFFMCSNVLVKNACNDEAGCGWEPAKGVGRNNQCVCCPSNDFNLPDRCIAQGE